MTNPTAPNSWPPRQPTAPPPDRQVWNPRRGNAPVPEPQVWNPRPTASPPAKAITSPPKRLAYALATAAVAAAGVLLAGAVAPAARLSPVIWPNVVPPPVDHVVPLDHARPAYLRAPRHPTPNGGG